MTISEYEKFTHVSIGIFTDSDNRVLVSKRPQGVHLQGMLEFPGGKRGKFETPEQALKRELSEELGVDVLRVARLIQFNYSYPEKNVFLDVYKILEYSGTITANENQELNWIKISKLKTAEFPQANFGIIRAIQLPDRIAVTPNFSDTENDFLKQFVRLAASKNISIIHLRSHDLDDAGYLQLANECLKICKKYQKKLILNRNADTVIETKAHGLHLTSKKLLGLSRRPLNGSYLLSASCHNTEEIKHAVDIGLDYIFLGPVIEKKSNQENTPLGLNVFSTILERSLIPVYAIGGLSGDDIKKIVQCGGQGIAAIREFWL